MEDEFLRHPKHQRSLSRFHHEWSGKIIFKKSKIIFSSLDMNFILYRKFHQISEKLFIWSLNKDFILYRKFIDFGDVYFSPLNTEFFLYRKFHENSENLIFHPLTRILSSVVNSRMSNSIIFSSLNTDFILYRKFDEIVKLEFFSFLNRDFILYRNLHEFHQKICHPLTKIWSPIEDSKNFRSTFYIYWHGIWSQSGFPNNSICHPETRNL